MLIRPGAVGRLGQPANAGEYTPPPSGPSDGVLAESGDFIVTEAGDFIVQE